MNKISYATSRSSKELIHISVADAITIVKDGEYKKVIELARAAKHEGRDKYNNLKSYLPVFYFSGVFESGKMPDNKSVILQPSDVFLCDVDKLSPVELQETIVKLKSIPSLLFCFVSPGGDGLKFAFKLRPGVVVDDKSFKTQFNEVNCILKSVHNIIIDQQCKDFRRCCYVSYDPNAYYNGECAEWVPYLQDNGTRNASLFALALLRLTSPKSENVEFYNNIVIEGDIDSDLSLEAFLSMIDRYKDDNDNDSHKDWNERLSRNDKGNILYTSFNTNLILENDPVFAGAFGYDEFIKSITVRGEPLRDADIFSVVTHLAEKYFRSYKVTKASVYENIVAVAHNNRYDSLMDYCNSLVWDGTTRVEKFATEYLKCVGDKEYLKAVSRAFFCGAIMRAMVPGSQVDTMTILESSLQGTFKTSTYRALFGKRFVEVSTAMNSKDFLVNMNGAWLYYHGELSSLSKGEAKDVKRMLTCREDTFRAPYATCSETHYRRCVWAGDTNESTYLQDDTGARRFLSLTNPNVQIDLKAVQRDSYQFFAEAMAWFKQGSMGEWWIVPGASEVQADKHVADPWVDIWEAFEENCRGLTSNGLVKGQGFSDFNIDKFKLVEVLEPVFGVKPENQNKSHSNRAGKVLRSAGYEYKNTVANVKFWVK